MTPCECGTPLHQRCLFVWTSGQETNACEACGKGWQGMLAGEFCRVPLALVLLPTQPLLPLSLLTAATRLGAWAGIALGATTHPLPLSIWLSS